MADILLGLGANLGDPVAAIRRALALLGPAGIVLGRSSSFYRTAPWGVVDQPPFVNLCTSGRTDLGPRELLCATQTIERAVGRVPGPRWGPRAIDVDLLDYDGLRLDEPGLTLPHPRLTERAFVLVPLAEIVPERVIAGRPVRDWAASIPSEGVEVLARVPSPGGRGTG